MQIYSGTKESVCIRKEFSSHRIVLLPQYGRRFIVLEHQYGRRDVMWKRSIRLLVFRLEKQDHRCLLPRLRAHGASALCMWLLYIKKKDVENSTLNQRSFWISTWTLRRSFCQLACVQKLGKEAVFSAYMYPWWRVKLDKSRAIISFWRNGTILCVKPTRNHRMDQLLHKTLKFEM